MTTTDRKKLDQYFTPPELALELVRLLPLKSRDRVLEPHAGAGAFVGAVQQVQPKIKITANEIDAQLIEAQSYGTLAVFCSDFLEFQPSDPETFDWIIGNPPFHSAEEHVRKALELLRPGKHCAFLLRSGFLASDRRAEFFRAQPPRKIWQVSQRPSFSMDGKTDSSDYVWIWWMKGFRGEPSFSWVSWDKRKAA